MAAVSSSSNVTGFENISKATSNSQTTSTSKTLGKDDFLQMLIAQMKNQDPTQPMSGTDFAAQLAQYSQLEQLTNMTSEIQNQSLTMDTMAQTQAVGMIGKIVTVEGGNTVNANGSSVDIAYSLAKDAQQVEINIKDQNGNLVKTIEAADQTQGANSVTWDSSSVANGVYTYDVTAKDVSGNSVDVTPFSAGTVSAVQFKDNEIYAIVNGAEVPMSSIKAVA